MSTRGSIALRYIIRPREELDHPDMMVLSVYREYGVVPKASRADNFNKTPIDLCRYQLVRPGDLVVNKMKAWQGSLGISEYQGIVSPDYLVCSVSREVHGRYLHYLLRSSALIGEYSRLAKGIRPQQWRIYWDDLAGIRVELPAYRRQQQIAGFLDQETVRIEALIAAKQKMVEVFDERSAALIEEAAALDFECEPVPLRRVIVRIEQGWSPQCEARMPDDGEWGVLKVGCVSRGEFKVDEVKALPADLPARSEYLVVDGDLLMSRANTRYLVGSTAVVSGVRPKTLLCDKLYRIYLDERKVIPSFVNLWLQTRASRAQLELEATGASDSMQNIGQDTVRRILLPLPSLRAPASFRGPLWARARA